MGMWPAQPLAQPEAQSRAQSRRACVVSSTLGSHPTQANKSGMGFNHSTSELQGHRDPGGKLGLERALIFWLPTQGNLHYPELSPRHPERCEHSWAFTHSISSHPPFNPTK